VLSAMSHQYKAGDVVTVFRIAPSNAPPTQPQNHACRFEGIVKMKLQGSEVQDHETLQSQIGKIAENRLPLSGLEIFHGRLSSSLNSREGLDHFIKDVFELRALI
jgi:hypothetical protein